MKKKIQIWDTDEPCSTELLWWVVVEVVGNAGGVEFEKGLVRNSRLWNRLGLGDGGWKPRLIAREKGKTLSFGNPIDKESAGRGGVALT